MKFKIDFAFIAALLLMSACSVNRNTGAGSAWSPVSPQLQTQEVLQVFRKALPMDDEFIPTRVPAVLTLGKQGSDFHESSDLVAKDGESASFQAADSSEYAIWRFEATPDDSIGNLSVDFSGAQSGSICWIAVADYSTGRWDWLGSSSEGLGFVHDLAGQAGQHSSPAGFVYVAVLTDNNMPFKVDQVSIQYMDRYSISGVVTDMNDNPLEGVLLTTNLEDPQQVYSAADGSFSLPGLPNGSWALMAALDGYLFWPAITEFTVSGADVTGLELRGSPQVSGFVANDSAEPNDMFEDSYQMPLPSIEGESLSIIDDRYDYYSFDVANEGWHYVQFSGDETILFPSLRLHIEEWAVLNASAVISGANWVGYYFQRPGTYHVRVSCEGGAGAYDLGIHAGQVRKMTCHLEDSGGAGDGDDGLMEELGLGRLQVEFPEATATIGANGIGTVIHSHIPPLPGNIIPVDQVYEFSPASLEHDFSTGDLTQDFNFSALAPSDPMEPNNSKEDATELEFPMTEPVTGWIGGKDLTSNDNVDFFRFEYGGGKHLMATVRFPTAAPFDFESDVELLFTAPGGSGFSSSTLRTNLIQIRSNDAREAGTYHLELLCDGSLVPYELEVQEFDAVYMSVQYLMDGKTIGGQFSAHILDGDWFVNDKSTIGLFGVDIPLVPGEQVFVHYSRYGTEFIPEYEWLTVPGSDFELTPTAVPAADPLEPNDLHEDAIPLDFPLAADSHIAGESDWNDYYSFILDNPSALEVSIDVVNEEIELEVNISKSSHPMVLHSHVARGDRTFYYDAADADEYVIQVLAVSGSTEYSLSVTDPGFPVYRIKGTLDNSMPGEGYDGTYVLNHTTGEHVEPNQNSYMLGYYPDGTYEVQWLISNRNVVPPGKVPVVVSGADTGVNFGALYDDKDSHEPNDSSSTASTVSVPISVVATLDRDDDFHPTGRDSRDYYTFIAPSDGLFEFVVTPAGATPAIYEVELSEEQSFNRVNFGKVDELGGEQMMRWQLLAGETYYIMVECNSDLYYSLSGDYVP